MPQNSLNSDERSAVIAEAKSFIGTPWHHAARIKSAGVDCGMFLLECFERPGLIPHTEPPPYPADWHMHRSEEKYLAFVEKFACRIEGPPAAADVVTFKVGRCVSHAAIVIEWPVIIHSCIEHGVIMDDAVANAWLAERIEGFYAYDRVKCGR